MHRLYRCNEVFFRCFRVPEIVFQPTVVGVDQCGVSDTIEFILQYYPPEVQQRLVEVRGPTVADLLIMSCV